MQTEKSLAITGRFQRLAQLPRVIVVAVGILLVALVGLAGWSLTKSARTAPVAVDKQDDDFEAVAQRAAPAAVDKQNDNPPAAVVEKPRAESIDLLKGDLDETSLAYFKQKFPKSSNVDATVKFCSKIDSLWLEKMRIGEEEVPIDGTIESAQKQLDRLKRMTGKVHEIGEFVGRADPFLLREAYKFALCRAVVAQHRVDHNKKTRDGAATSAEMNAYSQAMKASEVHLPRTRHCYGVLKDAMEGLKLDTREFDDIFR